MISLKQNDNVRQLSFIITYIEMADQQDEFFVQPEVQEVRDLKPTIEVVEHQPHQAKPIREQAEHVHLKMVEIPKEQQYMQYRPFKFEHVSESQQSEDEEFLFAKKPVAEEFYSNHSCSYQRFNNKQLNRVGTSCHFTGLFIHRKVLLETNCKENHQLADALKQRFGKLDPPLYSHQKEDLIFDSKFQSGNLFAAYKVSSFQYDLLMESDTNSMGGSHQWFYFSVTNMIPGKNYTFSIVNFTKSDSLFNYGMAPAVYSLAQNRQVENLEQGWRRVGKQISYKKGKLPKENSKRFYYCLTFTVMASYDKDKLFIAHSYPYTTQKLSLYLNQKAIKNDQLVTRFNVGKTVSKRSIEGLIICHPINKKRDNRKAIIIMARQHPGQTQGSYVCEGVIDKLLCRSKQSDFLLKNYVFYVIPMVNPDGVVFGHYRCNLLGKDLNRKWNVSEKDQNCPQVVTIKSFIQQLSKDREIRFIIDLHGHSKKLNSFFYGNPCPEHPQVVRIFPFVCSKLHQGIQFLDCTFTTQECKKKAARVYLSNFYHSMHVYTFESSFYAYFQDGKKVQFTPKQYRKLGGALINSLFMQLEHEVKYQQSFEFNLKQYTSKEYTGSQFVKYLMELKNTKELMNIGMNIASGSDSKPEQGELNNEQMQSLKMRRQEESLPDSHSKTVKVTRRGIRQAREHNYHNKPMRNGRFLEMTKINSVLPDKFQLALQPIRKKQPLPEPITHPLTFAQAQTESKFEVKLFDLKASEIESCNLSNSEKRTSVTERRISSLMHSMNNNRHNIIIKVEEHAQNFSRPTQRVAQIHNRAIKNAFSQTMITFNKDQGKIRSSQFLPVVQNTERERYDLMWPKISQLNVSNNMRGQEITKQAEMLFNGMVKRFIKEKEIYRREQISNRSLQEKSNSLKKSQYSKR